MEAMTLDAVLRQIRAVPGVMSADIKGKRWRIVVADRDLYPVRRRAASWLARCETQHSGLLWEMESATSCGCLRLHGTCDLQHGVPVSEHHWVPTRRIDSRRTPTVDRQP